MIAFAVFSYYQKESPKPIVVQEIFATEKADTKPAYFPVLVIKDLGIDSNIYKAEEKDGVWKTDSRGVSKHDNVIYGHNWKSILGNLTNAKPGMVVEILEKNSIKKYVVDFTQEIDPSSTNIINQNADNKLVIYTCSGSFDTKRFVVVATKVS